jgi:hypothetical protein
VCDPDSGDPAGCVCDPSVKTGTGTCYTGPLGTQGKGICQTGTRTCDNGKYSACVGEVLPQTEICNYADDNCDGIVDNVQAIIEAGVVANCNSPACDPNYSDAGITCWGPDLGICGAGTLACQGGPKGGAPTGCNEFIHGGVPEICNGFDDDCNGIIDDGLTMDGPCTIPDGSTWPPDANPFEGGKPTLILGACQSGNLQCIDSDCTEHYCADAGDQCFPSQPVPEICDGIDNNCNGIIDENSCATTTDVQFGETYCCVDISYPTDVFCDSNIASEYPQYYSCHYAGP